MTSVVYQTWSTKPQCFN